MTQTSPTVQNKTLIELLQTGDPITIDNIKETATGALVQYAIQCISQGDTKRADSVMKLIDLVHKHSKDAPKDVKTDYSSFLDGLK